MRTNLLFLAVFLFVAGFGVWLLSIVPPDTTFTIVAGAVLLFGLLAIVRLWRVEWYDYQKQYWVKKGSPQDEGWR